MAKSNNDLAPKSDLPDKPVAKPAPTPKQPLSDTDLAKQGYSQKDRPTVKFKTGGKCMAKGGSVGRGDGIASKGKTRGKVR